MSASTLIARLAGPVFLVMGLGMLFEAETVRALSQEFLANRALIYFAGMLTLVAGLAIVNTHNLWVYDWRVIITVLGWLSVIGGVFRLLLPGTVQQFGTGMLATPNTMVVGGLFTLLIGAVLSFFGYEAFWAEQKRRRPARAQAASAAPAKRPAKRRAARPTKRRR
jgi:hypothetical protein